MKIDNELLAIGWYTYEHVIKPDMNYPDDAFEISGHDVAGILLFHGSPEYDTFNRMFMNQLHNYEQHIRIKKKQPKLELP